MRIINPSGNLSNMLQIRGDLNTDISAESQLELVVCAVSDRLLQCEYAEGQEIPVSIVGKNSLGDRLTGQNTKICALDAKVADLKGEINEINCKIREVDTNVKAIMTMLEQVGTSSTA